ncbi:MAG: prepilin-type N-terminal cleavage/methylation domain-containing protein [Bacillota bacterium]
MSVRTSKTFRRGAFTLVELLVVIAIIAIMIAILLPALKRAKESGNSIKCQAAMKQIITAMNMYAADHRGEMPLPPSINEQYPGTDAVTRSLMYFMSQQNSGVGVIRYDAGSFWKYLGVANKGTPNAGTERAYAEGAFYRIFNCPSDTEFRAVRYGSINPNASWTRNFSYSWNCHMRIEALGQPAVRKLSSVKQPAHKILLIEEWMPNDGMAWIQLNDQDDVPVFRHNGNGNYGFADGHVQSLTPKELGFKQAKDMLNPPTIENAKKSNYYFILNRDNL